MTSVGSVGATIIRIGLWGLLIIKTINEALYCCYKYHLPLRFRLLFPLKDVGAYGPNPHNSRNCSHRRRKPCLHLSRGWCNEKFMHISPGILRAFCCVLVRFSYLASLRFVLLAPVLWTGHQRPLAMTTGHTHSQQNRVASIHHFRHGQLESKSSQRNLHLVRQALHAGEDQLSEGHLL